MNLNFEKREIAFFEIAVLLISIFAFSYLVGEFSREDNSEVKNIFGLIFRFFDLIPSVSAQSGTSSFQCCPQTKSGAICQNILSDKSDLCDGGLLPTSCEQVSSCQVGCCVDVNEGLCTVKATQAQCSADGGTWQEGAECNIAECTRGCCVLGDNVNYVTDQRCTTLSSSAGFEKDFRDVGSELECLGLGYGLERGACVLSSGVVNVSATEIEGDNVGCKITTGQECVSLNGQFYENLLCSNPSLETSCERQVKVGLEEGKDEIYWFDSCGNRENIYSSDKDASWNEGELLTKSESCNPNSPNIDSEDCGNCNFLLGSKGAESGLIGKSVKDGNYICKDLNCEDPAMGEMRENGESWCVYDSFIGEGKDTVGSRHWKRVCIEGEVKVEPCADYRGQVCVESFVGVKSDGNSSVSIGNNESNSDRGFATASCVINEASLCLDYNQDLDTMPQKCNENNHCVLKEIDVDEGFSFDFCTSAYPRGLDFGLPVGELMSSEKNGNESVQQNLQQTSFDSSREDRSRGNSDMCNVGSRECTVVYVKKISGWECMFNCDCETEKFSEQMNDLCISLGDCGSYINYIGKGTDNAVVDGADDVSWQDYVQYAEPVEGQKVEPPPFSKSAAALSGEGGEENINADFEEEGGSPFGALGAVGTVAGVGGTVMKALAGESVFFGLWKPVSPGFFPAQAGLPATTIGLPTGIPGPGVTTFQLPATTAGGPAWVSGIGNALSGAAIGATVGGLVSAAFGLKGDAAMAVTVAGAAGGALGSMAGAAYATQAAAQAGATTVSTTGLASLPFASLGPLLASIIWAAIAAIVIAVIMKILGIGDTKEVIVSFECLPWTPPTGGEDCEKCNDDSLKPCSQYRCSSLGAACVLINSDSENPTCVNGNPNDVTPPEIKPIQLFGNDSNLSLFRFTEQESNSVRVEGKDSRCVQEFSNLIFTLGTDEYSQCKYSFSSSARFEDMNEYGVEGTTYTKNHTFVVNMPSIESLEITNATKRPVDREGNTVIYIQCQDTQGNKNLDSFKVNSCVKPGPDTTPPLIVATSPNSGAYLRQDINETNLVVFTNEPADCKVSKNKDTNYKNMEESMVCLNQIESKSALGYTCLLPLTNLNEEENKFYIKCEDQPWISEGDSKRNVNSQDFELILKKSKEILVIDSISPEGDITDGIEPISIDLEVQTSGGISDGAATCSYKLNDNVGFIQFLDTFSSSHVQRFDFMTKGDYEIEIKCIDEAKNVATGTAEFSLNLDTSPPFITRIYNDGGTMRVFTNEDASCYFSVTQCNFDIDGDNSREMTNVISKEHQAPWENGISYFIKCKDLFGNQDTGCSRITTSY